VKPLRNLNSARQSVLVGIACGLVALALASCSAKNPFAVDTPETSIDRPRLSGITLPESLSAGDSTIMWIHCSAGCAETFDHSDVVQDSAGNLTVEPRTLIRNNDGCIPGAVEQLRENAITMLVPAAGSRTVTVIGRRDSIVFELVANLPSFGARHVVEVVSRRGGMPIPGVMLSYYGSFDPADTLGGATTGPEGEAEWVPLCSNGPDGLTYLTPADADRNHWREVVAFRGQHALCGRALRTILLYDSEPGATAWPSSAAMYSSGSPWWRRPKTIAFR
jgi:hypothetical protein